jgi:phosphoribosylformylglycinamidine cyclo-ligase
MPDNSKDELRNSTQPLTYADAGVDVAAGNSLISRIKPLVARTHRDGVIGNIGGFGGLFELPVDRYHRPVMVSGTDGVGTKLKLAMDLDQHTGIGIDLVAMCVNDIIVCGAEPLWFLDYYATGKLNVVQAETVIAGIVEGCLQAGTALLGGETAEMPGMYSGEDYDLAGFAVGVVEKADIIDGSAVAAGNVIIGLFSSGPHANGFSLIRQITDQRNVKSSLGDTTLGQALLAPTRIYTQAVAAVLSSYQVNAMAHITGGGITENIPRVLPADMEAVVDRSRWELPEVFTWLQKQGNITDQELLKTFNCGIGLAMIVNEPDTQAILQILADAGESACVIGHVAEAIGEPAVRYL